MPCDAQYPKSGAVAKSPFCPHFASLASCKTAYLYWFRVNTEVIFTTINVICYASTYLFAKITGRLTAIVELPAGNEIRNEMPTFIQLGFKQPVLTIYFFSFCCHTQGYYFQIRETRNRTTTNNISFFINQFIGELLAYLQKIHELCIQVAHNQNIALKNWEL
mgnify:CR=1 FL=1